MADTSNSSPPSDRHRHAHRPAPGNHRRHVLLTVVGALVVTAIAAVLVLSSWDRSDDAVADEAVPTPVASTTPTSLPDTTPPASTPPATTPAPAAGETATTSDVPDEFAAAMQQIGIPLDAHTGWVVAQGICVRLGQPQYDEFKLSEGVERLFPSVPDEQAHEFVAMVAESVCHG